MFAKNLYDAIVAIRQNIDWHNKGAKPPVDRLMFYKLMVSWEFEPFNQHLRLSQQRAAQRHLNVIEFFYETFNQEGQEEMRHQLDRDNNLRNVFTVYKQFNESCTKTSNKPGKNKLV